MKRLLTTTAVLMSLSGPALAETHSMGFGSIAVEQGDFLASDLIGMRIYSSEQEMDVNTPIVDGAEQEWDDIGEINDIIMSADGNVTAVILGVGGFLGIGERDVTVSMDQIKVLREEGDSDDRFLVVNATKEMLENAPAYERNMNNDVARTNADATDNVATTDNAATSEMATDPIDRQMLAPPMVEREGYAEAEADMVTNLTAEDLEGTYVYGPNEETVGEIGALVLGDSGKIEHIVINVGGFLGMGEKPVAVTFEELRILKNIEGDDFRLYIDSTKETLEAQPEYEG